MPDDQTTSEMMVIVFPGAGKAAEVLEILRQLSQSQAVHLGSAATISRDADGKLSIQETHDFKTSSSVIAGALAGALIGGLTRGKWLEGAAIGGTGGFVTGKVVDLGFKDSYLQEIADGLGPDSSAEVAVAHFDNVELAMKTLDQFSGGRVIRSTLPPDVAQRLVQVVED